MPRYGGFAPYPRRYGGGECPGGKTLYQAVFESVASQRGTAYDQGLRSGVGIENLAIARAIAFDGYGADQRLTNNFLPATMTSDGLLPRWEAIFDEPALPGDTDVVRRARIANAWISFGLPNEHSVVTGAISSAIGSLFVGSIVYQTPATASIFWPGNGANTATIPWMSTIAHILIPVILPAAFVASGGGPNAAWYTAIGAMVPTLESILPAWITYDWFLQPSTGTGFLLDEPDLDLEIFDV